MLIKKELNGKSLIISLNGRLDTNTSHDLESVLTEVIPSINDVCFDFTELEYITSSGLRILLAALKKISNNNGCMYIENANDVILDIMKITGFDSIMQINTGFKKDDVNNN